MDCSRYLIMQVELHGDKVQKCKKMLKAVFGKIYSDKIHCERFGSKGTTILKMVKYEIGVNLLNQFASKD